MLEKKWLQELEEYVGRHQVLDSYDVLDEIIVYSDKSIQDLHETELDQFIRHHKKPAFRDVLFEFIDRNGASDVEVYKKAWLDRKHFSKIRSNPEYHPKKNTVLALAFALELDMDDTETLLSAAGYSLSGSETFDLVIQFCIEKGIYHIDDVNEALDYLGLRPLIS